MEIKVTLSEMEVEDVIRRHVLSELGYSENDAEIDISISAKNSYSLAAVVHITEKGAAE